MAERPLPADFPSEAPMDRLRLRRHCLTATGAGLTALAGTLPLWWLLGRLGDHAGSQVAGVIAFLAALLTVGATAGATLASERTADVAGLVSPTPGAAATPPSVR